MAPRQHHLITRSGPYRVESLANGELRVTPEYSQLDGVPGVLTRMELARQIERLLNGRPTGGRD